MAEKTTFAVSIALAAMLVLATTACTRPLGDFGRARPSILHDEIMPAVGTWRPRGVDDPVSSFAWTDQEKAMRDHVWRYLVAPYAGDWFGDVAVELQRTRLAPPGRLKFDRAGYFNWLKSERFASSRVRYSRVSDDVSADIGTMPAAFASICAVIEVDRQRALAQEQFAGPDNGVAAEVRARKAENGVVIEAFVRATGYRYDSYAYALDHLLVETPHEEAVKLNGLLSDLAIYVDAAEAGDFCSDATGSSKNGGIALRSRMLHTEKSEGQYRK